MNFYRKRLVILLSSMLVSLLFIGLGNYLLDTRGIFRSDFSKQPIEPNKHFIKMKYLTNNPNIHDSFLFGSSRVGPIDVNLLENGKWYNMTYSEGLPQEYYNDLLLLLDSGVKVKNVIIGLDDFSFKVDPQKHYGELSRYPYENSNIKYYFKYLLNIPDVLVVEPFLKKIASSPYETLPTKGADGYEIADRRIEQNPYAHVNSKVFNKPTHYEGERIESTITTIRQIILLCEENNIELKIFFNPIHKTTYMDSFVDEINEFKNKLAQLTDFYDFSGLNSVTSNNYYFFETSHYRPIVGEFIINKIFNLDTVKVPQDFGELRKQNNNSSEKEVIKHKVIYSPDISMWKERNDVTLTVYENELLIKSLGRDPYFESDEVYHLSSLTSSYFLEIDIDILKMSNESDYMQFFFKTVNEKYNEEESIKVKVKPGKGRYYVPLPNVSDLKMRIDPLTNRGELKIKKWSATIKMQSKNPLV